MSGTHSGPSCTEPTTLQFCTGMPSILILSAQERAVCGAHFGPSSTQTVPLPVCTEATLPDFTGATYLLSTLFNNIRQERAVRGTHLGLSCTQPKPLQFCTGMPSILILSAQELAVCGTHIGLSYTQPAPLLICTKATLPNCTGANSLVKELVEIFGVGATEEPPPDWTGAQYQMVRWLPP